MNPGSFFVALHINNWSSGPILIMLSRPPILFLRKWLEFFVWSSLVPVAFQRGQCQIGSHIVSSSFYAVQDHIVFLQFGDLLASPLRTEICGVLFDNTRGLLT